MDFRITLVYDDNQGVAFRDWAWVCHLAYPGGPKEKQPVFSRKAPHSSPL